MGLIKNQFGAVDLQATAADFDKRIAAIEALVASDVRGESQLQTTQQKLDEAETAKLTDHDSRIAALESELAALRAAMTTAHEPMPEEKHETPIGS